MTDETNPAQGFSMQKGFEYYRLGDFGAAYTHFDQFAKGVYVLPLVKESAEEIATALLMSGIILRDYYKEPESSYTYLTKAATAATGAHNPKLEEEIQEELRKIKARRKLRK